MTPDKRRVLQEPLSVQQLRDNQQYYLKRAFHARTLWFHGDDSHAARWRVNMQMSLADALRYSKRKRELLNYLGRLT